MVNELGPYAARTDEHGAGALTSSKYFGKNGLDALSAILQHADRYGLNGFHEGSVL